MNPFDKLMKTPAMRRVALRRHMAECPFTSLLGRALWRAMF